MQIEVFNTGDNSELVSTLPVTYGEKKINVDPNSNWAFRVVYSLKLTNIKIGDVISFVAQGEVSNKLTYNVMVASYIILGKSTKAVKGIEVVEAASTNLNPERHHHKYSDVGFYKFKENFNEVYLNAIWYSASTAAQVGHSIIVEKDYGNIQAMLFRV